MVRNNSPPDSSYLHLSEASSLAASEGTPMQERPEALRRLEIDTITGCVGSPYSIGRTTSQPRIVRGDVNACLKQDREVSRHN